MGDDAGLDDIISEFVAEARDGMRQAEAALLAAERQELDEGGLQSLFRAVHSLKGSVSFLGYGNMQAVLHASESLLSPIRDGERSFDAPTVAVLLQMVDCVSRMIEQIELDGTDADHSVDRVVEALVAATRGTVSEESSEPPAHDASDQAATEASTSDALKDFEAVHSAHSSDEGIAAARNGPVGGKVRVDVQLLDRLMNLVGELVLARNQVLQSGAASATPTLVAPFQRLNLVTTELQETVMKTRMQAIDTVWSRFPRVVRDIAKMSGKQVRLLMEGADTELDKGVIEAITDPLVHLVRNAIAHGIETAQQRQSAGKPAQGTLRLRAFHEGGMVNIEVGDDGAGVDIEALKERAVQMGRCTAQQAQVMEDRDALNLLFLPGLSTAKEVTEISGRGVGLDVVRANIEAIGGTIEFHSEQHRGTLVRVKIPLTLAIIPALVVECRGARYAVPQASVVEVVRIAAERVATGIENVRGAPVYRLRGKLLPLLFLDEELGLVRHGAAREARDVAVVVLQCDGRRFGLVVDDIRDTEEIVVKPLWKYLKSLRCYAGSTIMGDGGSALILDAVGLAERTGFIAEAQQSHGLLAEEDVEERRDGHQMVLLCRLNTSGRLAIPLDHVARLEEIVVDRLERVGNETVGQYRGDILPIYDAADILEERRRQPRDGDFGNFPDDGTVSVVVFRGERPLGLVVHGILDILSVSVQLRRDACRRGVLGTMVVQDRATEFLDVTHLFAQLDRNADGYGAPGFHPADRSALPAGAHP